MKIKFTGNEEEVRLAEHYLEIITGDYSPTQQYAASILMHMLLKEEYGNFTEAVKEMTGFKVNDRNSSRVIAWKKKVKAAGKCEMCGATNELVAHHKIPWAYSITGRLQVENGQCLCKECHKIVHNDEMWLEYMISRERKE